MVSNLLAIGATIASFYICGGLTRAVIRFLASRGYIAIEVQEKASTTATEPAGNPQRQDAYHQELLREQLTERPRDERRHG